MADGIQASLSFRVAYYHIPLNALCSKCTLCTRELDPIILPPDPRQNKLLLVTKTRLKWRPDRMTARAWGPALRWLRTQTLVTHATERPHRPLLHLFLTPSSVYDCWRLDGRHRLRAQEVYRILRALHTPGLKSSLFCSLPFSKVTLCTDLLSNSSSI